MAMSRLTQNSVVALRSLGEIVKTVVILLVVITILLIILVRTWYKLLYIYRERYACDALPCPMSTVAIA